MRMVVKYDATILFFHLYHKLSKENDHSHQYNTNKFLTEPFISDFLMFSTFLPVAYRHYRTKSISDEIVTLSMRSILFNKMENNPDNLIVDRTLLKKWFDREVYF